MSVKSKKEFDCTHLKIARDCLEKNNIERFKLLINLKLSSLLFFSHSIYNSEETLEKVANLPADIQSDVQEYLAGIEDFCLAKISENCICMM